MKSFPTCANQSLILEKEKKGLNICLNFKFDLQSFNYFKINKIKLNFTKLSIN
jgi:hypothetical protein